MSRVSHVSPMSRLSPLLTRMVPAATILTAVLCAAVPDTAAQSFPVPGTAPGSQTATADPFTGLARSPEADLFTGTASASIT